MDEVFNRRKTERKHNEDRKSCVQWCNARRNCADDRVPCVLVAFPSSVFTHVLKVDLPWCIRGRIRSFAKRLDVYRKRSSRCPWTFPEETGGAPVCFCDAVVSSSPRDPACVASDFVCQRESTATVGLLFVAASRQNYLGRFVETMSSSELGRICLWRSGFDSLACRAFSVLDRRMAGIAQLR